MVSLCGLRIVIFLLFPSSHGLFSISMVMGKAWQSSLSTWQGDEPAVLAWWQIRKQSKPAEPGVGVTFRDPPIVTCLPQQDYTLSKHHSLQYGTVGGHGVQNYVGDIAESDHNRYQFKCQTNIGCNPCCYFRDISVTAVDGRCGPSFIHVQKVGSMF